MRTSLPASKLLAVDWGTSSLRAAQLSASGEVLAERAWPRGILSVPAGQFEQVLDDCVGDWRTAGLPTVISGMAGSRQGWQEAPYCPCPAGFDELAAQLVPVATQRAEAPVWLVPGLRCEQAQLPDVMRGEEVQIFGAMALLQRDEGLFVLPGTHSKWAQVRQGRVQHFRTFMTGEFFAVLRQHSILGRTLRADAAFQPAAFMQGVACARTPGGLLHHAFSARTLALFERLDADALNSYLSGLLIGTELRDQEVAAGQSIVLIGAPALTASYALALQAFGASSTALGAEATWAGLHALARQGVLPSV